MKSVMDVESNEIFFFLMMRHPQRSPLFPTPPLSRPPRAAAPPPAGRAAAAARHRHHRRPAAGAEAQAGPSRSEEHTSELQSRQYLVCRLLLEKKKNSYTSIIL